MNKKATGVKPIWETLIEGVLFVVVAFVLVLVIWKIFAAVSPSTDSESFDNLKRMVREINDLVKTIEEQGKTQAEITIPFSIAAEHQVIFFHEKIKSILPKECTESGKAESCVCLYKIGTKEDIKDCIILKNFYMAKSLPIIQKKSIKSTINVRLVVTKKVDDRGTYLLETTESS